MEKIRLVFETESDKKQHQESVEYDEKYVYYVVDPESPVYSSSEELFKDLGI